MEATTNTILIVEDDTHLIELLTEKVESCGYKTICMLSAQDALLWLQEHFPLLMILDYSLPDMNGKEFIAQLIAKEITIPPFIVSTGQGDERIAVEMMKLGARDYIIKDNQFLEMLPLVITNAGNEIKNEISLRQTKSALIELDQFNKQIIQSAHEGVIAYDRQLNFKLWNPFMENLTGIPASDVLKNYAGDVFPFLKEVGMIENHEKALQGESLSEINFPFTIPSTGKSGWVSETIGPLVSAAGEITGIIGTVRDITERKQTERYREMATDILQILNEQKPLQDSIEPILAVIKSHSGIDAVGIRLKDGEDFPYYGHVGFDEVFLKTENSIVERDLNGHIIRDQNGSVHLECTCGLVLSAKTVPSNSLFTPGGSFWTNDSFPLIELAPELEIRHNPRNQCMHHGYASMALVPIRTKNKIIGLIHLDDRRNNCFSLAIVEQLESIAAHIGEAIMRKQTEKTLLESEENLAEAQRIAKIGSWELDLNTNKVIWSQEMYDVFDICPETSGTETESLLKAIHPEDVDIFNNYMNSFISDAKSNSCEYRVIHKDNSIHYILAESRIKIDEAGKPIKRNGTAQDITERKIAEAERNSLEQMHLLAQYTEKAREDERTAISRELHDDLGQALTAIKIDLGLIKRMVSDNEAVSRINNLYELVGETIKTVQRLTSQLRPQMLDDLGLELTLDWYTKEFAIRNRIEINTKINSELDLSHDASLNLFRIVQESLTNIARHAKATHVEINISETDDCINLRITDNGIGINEEKLKSKDSFGIISMKERTALLGGTLNIYNKNNAGTEIMLILPINYKMENK